MNTFTLGLSEIATAEDAIVLFVALAAVTAGVSWITSVALWTIALRRPNPRTRSLAQRLALPGTRRLAQTLLARSMMATSLLAVPACSTGASDAEIPSLVWVDEKPTSSTGPDITEINPPPTPSSPALPTTAPPTTAPPTTAPPAAQAASDPAFVEPAISGRQSAATHVVRTGEHLWSIAAQHAGDQLGRTATNNEVSEYWRRLVELNRHRLFSGDPDLIHPGEVVQLA